MDKAEFEFNKQDQKDKIIKICEFYNLPLTTKRIKDIDTYIDMCDKYIKTPRDGVSYFLDLAYASRFGKTKKYWQKIFDKD